ncbi:MAG TPA: DUF4870 domain-containing protein [Pyrinomonadaceae bacterium]|jgi:uncharacterized membrane protein
MQNMSSDKSALGLDANVVAGLCYVGNLVCALGLILSIVTIVTDKTNKLARFHAFQSIFLSVLGFVLGFIYWIVAIVGIVLDRSLGFPIFSLLLTLLVLLIALVLFIGTVFAAIKAFQGQIFKLPVIGKFADQYSN